MWKILQFGKAKERMPKFRIKCFGATNAKCRTVAVVEVDNYDEAVDKAYELEEKGFFDDNWTKENIVDYEYEIEEVK